MDFTLRKYKDLLKALLETDSVFQTYSSFLKHPVLKPIILRHDVDLLPKNSLMFAQIQHELGIRGSYYFRAVPESWDEAIIKEIHSLGHEVGYHYESLTTCKGDVEAAIKDFEANLKKLRKLVPVSTICMHGSPRSPHDSKDLWKQYKYQDYDIIGEPYFDTDFSDVLYLTDTGRRWDGDKVSVRDRVEVQSSPESYRELKTQSFHRTNVIIKAAERGVLADKVMFTFHPQRWTDKPLPWVKELIWQNIKNIIKKHFFVQ